MGAMISSLARVQCDWTPLHIASFNGYTAIAALLLEKGADVHAKDSVSGGCRDVWAPSARQYNPYIAAVMAAVCCAVVSQAMQRRRYANSA